MNRRNKKETKKQILRAIQILEGIQVVLVVMLFGIVMLIIEIGKLEIEILEDQLLNKFDYYLYEERIPVKEAIKLYIDSLPMQKIKLEKIINEKENQIPSSEDNPTRTTFNTSAYCSCESCCGKSDGITASGEKATAWYTVAAGKEYKIGTKIYIPELQDTPSQGWFMVQDRGGAISNDKLDIYLASHTEALEFGRRNLECYVYQ